MDADSLDVLFTIFSHSTSDPFCAHLQTAPREIRKLLSEYPDILSYDGFSASTPKHGVFHDLPTIPGPPVFAKAHRLDPDKLVSTQANFLKMEKAGVSAIPPHCGPVLFTWCLNLMAPGNLGENSAAVSDFSTRIFCSKFFSKLDLQKGYFKIPMRPIHILRPPSSLPLDSLSSSASFLA